MIKVVDLTTGEVLLERSEKVSISFNIDGHEQLIATKNEDGLGVYLRDPVAFGKKERPDIDLQHTGMGLWAKMKTP